MACAQCDRKPGVGTDDGSRFRHYAQRAQRAGVLGDIGIDKIGKSHHHRGLGIGVRGIDEARRLGVAVGKIDLDIASLLSDLGSYPDIVAAAAIVVKKRLAIKHAVVPGRDYGARLLLGGIEN